MIEEINDLLKEFFEDSELNRLPEKYGGGKIFSDPLLGVASGADPIFLKFKDLITPEYLTPLELWTSANNSKTDSSKLRVLSIVFPFVPKIREESKNTIKLSRLILPAEIYCVGRNYANEFKKETLRYVIKNLVSRGYNAVGAMLSNAFTVLTEGDFYSNWSERHTAFAAGLGTFSLHEGLITEAGCNIRLASLVTDAPLEITPKKIKDPYANCLYYAKGTCRKCEENCPANAITENGHDKIKCYVYGRKVERKVNHRIGNILKPHYRRIDGKYKRQEPPVGCAFCQFNVPCMNKNPMKDYQEDGTL
ncbi:MAG: hypothetical protein GF383_09475 [Candidatus Lokiarchaeota archaeon]|nr:hypothetical protein [Candidatus Lokiarchaeota archaeon]MBD3340743.1 hypothetical protein [Candidatus Lokiarchaeota archaeon]